MLRMYEKIFLHFSFIVKWKNVFKDRVVVVRMYECMKMYEDLFPYHRIIFFFRVRFFYHTSSYIPTFVFVIRIYFFLYEECMKNSSYSLFVSLFVRKNRLFSVFLVVKKKTTTYVKKYEETFAYSFDRISDNLRFWFWWLFFFFFWSCFTQHDRMMSLSSSPVH